MRHSKITMVLGEQSYGEWIIYQDKIPTYHIDLFNLKYESNRILKKIIEDQNGTIEQIIEAINTKHNLNLHFFKRTLFSIKTSSDLIRIELKPFPLEYLCLNRENIDR